MDKKLYEMMDWARIEGLVYSEENQPHDFLGAHITQDGVLIQSFIPTAAAVEVVLEGTGKHYPMEKEDEAGFFAVLLPRKSVPKYTLVVTYDDGSNQEFLDPYCFVPQIPKKITDKFNRGIAYDIYQYLGAHAMTIDGVEGTGFAVWAPNALRVSLVGDFNMWDGRRLPMKKLTDSGIYAIFIPQILTGSLYKYEIKAKNGLTFLKSDPYANQAEYSDNGASVVTDISDYVWHDENWLKERAGQNIDHAPMIVYEMHLDTWKCPEEGDAAYNYREIAPMLADYVKEMGYTHVELLPVMEHRDDMSLGYQISAYYAPTSRFGDPQDFMYFIDYLHQQGIGVILDWDAARMPKDLTGLSGFDGTLLYEHPDARQRQYPEEDAYCYNYGRPEVSNFLLSNALFWTKEYHADGIKIHNMSAMLYLDYGRSAGEWSTNIYGGNENLEAVEFIKHLSSIYHKECAGALLIAQETMAWTKVTGALDDDGLGLDLKWNNGWNQDFLGYMELDPVFRGYHHGDLTFSMIYNYSEKFMVTFSHEDVSDGNAPMIRKMPGREKYKFANLRAAYGYMFSHPGKKLLFMAQDWGQFERWSSARPIEWDILRETEHSQFVAYMKDLVKLYHENPALYAMDYDVNGFEWINDISANENMIVFLRKTEIDNEALLVVCNFSNMVYTDHKIGLPFAGKYKEIFNSDREEYGGAGNVNPRVKNSKKDECDGKEDSIRITVPPLGISVFRCTKAEPDKSANSLAKSRKRKTTKSAASEGRESLKKKLEDQIYQN